jgi:hypothetical protein
MAVLHILLVEFLAKDKVWDNLECEQQFSIKKQKCFKENDDEDY